jgi:hypothetical protein
MRAIVLKEFPYSHDGMKIEQLPEGTVFECRGDIYSGLKAEKFVDAVVDEPLTEKKVELPPEIQALIDAAEAAEAAAAEARDAAKKAKPADKQAAFAAAKELDEKSAAARKAADEALATLKA